MVAFRQAAVGLGLAAILLAPRMAAAQVYRWVDGQGRVHYSEGLDSVPSAYRPTARPLDLPKPAPPPPEKVAPEKEPASRGRPGDKPLERKPAGGEAGEDRKG